MKKIVFSLIISIALVVMAGSAYAQLNNTPYQGGTYSYTLSGITVVKASTATVSYTGDDATLPTPIAISIGANQSITFDVDYGVAATSGILKVTIIGDVAGDCSNFIELAIDVQSIPTLDISILASAVDPICQPINNTPDDNEAASLDVTGNTFTFTVTPTVTGVSADYGYTYEIALPATSNLNGYVVSYSGSGTYVPATGVVTKGDDTTDDVFTITYNTTTGIANETITATISDATLTETTGGGTYTGTFTTATDNVVVKTLPSIGSFTIE